MEATDSPTGRTCCPVLAEYFARVDGGHPQAVVELLAPDFRFATIWGEETFARPSAGGIEELRAYFADGWREVFVRQTSFQVTTGQAPQTAWLSLFVRAG